MLPAFCIITLVVSFDYSGMSIAAKERVKKIVCELECAILENSTFTNLYQQSARTNTLIERHCQQTHEEFALVNSKLDRITAKFNLKFDQINGKLDRLLQRLEPVFIFMDWKTTAACLIASLIPFFGHFILYYMKGRIISLYQVNCLTSNEFRKLPWTEIA
jgi:hypothetical protein